MTKTDQGLWLNHTSDLAQHHKFYPPKISVAHHQLRHLCSSAEQDLIYYISRLRDVFVLDVSSDQASLIATVPFDARCLAAGLGWVCVGGEQNGDCVFIKVEKDEHDRPTCFGHDMNTEALGGEIVNSMNVHTILNHGKTPDEPVVLISNNDKTVKIYSLAQRQVLATLSHTNPMNFATLSPDSEIIAAVGDSDRIYFYRRRLEEAAGTDGSGDKYARYAWDKFAEPQVPTGEAVYDDYSFAVTFSSSGQLCAASSQGGSISVFEMQSLLDSDDGGSSALLWNFKSSRTGLFGCVRSMSFSPAPWDLLVWAEDHGRIGIADVRQGCVRRQILELDSEKSDIVKVEDGTPVAYRGMDHKDKIKQQHLARLRAMRGLASGDLDDAPSTEGFPDAEARQINQENITTYRGLDLDARERSVVDALETTMDTVEPPPARPYSINYTSSPRWFASRIPSEATNQTPGPVRSITSRSHHPRRRSSVVLSDSAVNASRYLDITDGHRARLSASPGRIGDEDEQPVMSTNDLTPSGVRTTSHPTPSDIPANDPWHVIQTALESARETDNSSRANLARIEAALEAERQLGNQLERQLSDERQLSLLLRRQLDTQQRLLADNTNQLEHLREAARQSNARVEASLERVLQRQLASEQQFLNQRAQELQSELRVGTDYSRRLESERERLRREHDSPSTSETTTVLEHTSAQTSALPTTNLRSSDITHILTDYSESRRERLAHIENLQRQVRRAESRVALAAIDIQALESAIRREMGDDNRTPAEEAIGVQPPQSSTRVPTLNAATHTNTARRGSARRSTSRPQGRAAMMTNPPWATPDGRAPTTRVSELAGRVPDADMRLARMMFLSGMSSNRSLDANGNWLPPAAGAVAATVPRRVVPGSAREAGYAGAILQALDAEEPGTAGLGFSPDGRYLYVGTEEGIFEFKINMRDRMVFPAFEMR